MTMTMNFVDGFRIAHYLKRLPTVLLVPLALVLTYAATMPTVVYFSFHPEATLGGPAGWGKMTSSK